MSSHVARLLVLGTLFSVPVAAQLATATAYGAGCPQPLFGLTPAGLPQLGSSFALALPPNTCPNPGGSWCLPVFALGLAQANAAFVVPGFGLGTGCTILVSPDVLITSATETLVINIPNQTALIGFGFYVQGAVLSVPSVFPAPPTAISFTNGVHCTIGL